MTESGLLPVSITKMAAMQIGKVQSMKKSVFITGATNGTGFAIAARFAREGYDVFIGSRSGENSAAAAQKIAETYGVFAKGYQTKIFDEDNVKAIFADIRSMGYLLDTLVLNAANLGQGQESLTVDIQAFMHVYHTNIGWNFLLAREAAKQMMEKKKGAIVFITSNSAHRVTQNRCAYCSSKSAILAMSKSFAVDWGKYGIRSNCVLPGMIKTERWKKNENNIQYILPNYTPIEDIAEFEDIANAAWYFGSEESRNTTGAELVVDGGMLAQLTPNIDRELWKK
ncbi:MAG: SDR family oxidoreductase [Clostridia bacterium]|nr:SDR family oxidoreductase [Clostridia bacterium]